jgi:uncharacterized protein YbjQ (UPF0145 family)
MGHDGCHDSMIEPESIVTFDKLDGYRIVKRYGYVSGVASRPRNRLRATFRSLGMLIGVTPNEFLSDAEYLRSEALDALRKRAEVYGANAVIGLSFHVSEGDDGSCKIVAFGEAIHASRIESGDA